MANMGLKENFSRFQVFTGNPSNIVEACGYGVAEVEISRGKPETHLDAVPMAAPAVTDAQLALERRGSDKARLGTPQNPHSGDPEGNSSHLRCCDHALRKLNSPIMRQLSEIVDRRLAVGGAQADSMKRSLGCVQSGGHLLKSLVDLARVVQANLAQGLN